MNPSLYALQADRACQDVFSKHPIFTEMSKQASLLTLSDPQYCGKMRVGVSQWVCHSGCVTVGVLQWVWCVTVGVSRDAVGVGGLVRWR